MKLRLSFHLLSMEEDLRHRDHGTNLDYGLISEDYSIPFLY